MKRAIVLTSCFVVMQGCAGPPFGGHGPGAAEQSSSANPQQVCNPVLVGGLAGLTCAVVSSGNRRVLTGAACAAAALVGCYLVNSYKAQQVRTAQQVEDDYKRANRQLPERAALTEYVSQIDPTTASRGQNVAVGSHIKVVRGRNDQSVNVEEEIGIFDAKDEAWGKPVRKVANADGQAGEYQTSFTIPIHQGMSQGVYRIRKTIYLNGAAAASDDKTKFQVVQLTGGAMFAVLK